MNAEKVAQYIVEWMDAYLKGTGAAGFVVGISGGIDSAVVSSLAAMTGRRTLCVTLPIHQARSQVDRAAEHVARLTARFANAEAAHADLTAPYEAFRAAFDPTVGAGASQATVDLAGANARSRLRMTALYYFAGMNNLLVAGTDHTITTTIAGGRGFTAVMVSWLAGFNPLNMVLTSFLLVFLDRGAAEISTDFGLNHAFGDILTGIILFFIIGSEFFARYEIRFRKSAGKEG